MKAGLVGLIVIHAVFFASATRAEINQQTWDLVAALTRTHVKYPYQDIEGIHGIANVKLTGAVLGALPGTVTRLSDDTSLRIQKLSYFNCSGNDVKWVRKITTTKRNSATVKMTKTVSTTTATTIEAKASLFGLVDSKATFKTEDKISVTDDSTQTFSFDEVVSTDEDFTIPAKTHMTYYVMLNDNVGSYQLDGTAIIDAEVSFTFRMPVIGKGKWAHLLLSSSSISAEPGPRTLPLQALVTTTQSSDIRVSFNLATIADDEPSCSPEARKLTPELFHIAPDGLIEQTFFEGRL